MLQQLAYVLNDNINSGISETLDKSVVVQNNAKQMRIISYKKKSHMISA